LIKTTLISSVSHLNFGLKPCLGSEPKKKLPAARGLIFGPPLSLGDKLADICLMQIIA